uniref:Uncharacterized protein n=1 Tax=Chromera velia CCMP2878 TaxID=1169474 RepID=A0A0G4GLC9_9ALVE|eukprot:Cvel_699.t1-p1 / transcript=Cvel_699.t1 / gene=Cvel_699 / organism=Chromera_velia_CCMP2878 / gene_product=hypothetical protein / transcript_product=hypothetical protein / location=Cvel_scaffold21:162777-177088(-) / protein_length=1450 / sequence_SO=supercontig / SO=protein_coding / is_pseudo=false
MQLILSITWLLLALLPASGQIVRNILQVLRSSGVREQLIGFYEPQYQFYQSGSLPGNLEETSKRLDYFQRLNAVDGYIDRLSRLINPAFSGEVLLGSIILGRDLQQVALSTVIRDFVAFRINRLCGGTFLDSSRTALQTWFPLVGNLLRLSKVKIARANANFEAFGRANLSNRNRYILTQFGILRAFLEDIGCSSAQLDRLLDRNPFSGQAADQAIYQVINTIAQAREAFLQREEARARLRGDYDRLQTLQAERLQETKKRDFISGDPDDPDLDFAQRERLQLQNDRGRSTERFQERFRRVIPPRRPICNPNSVKCTVSRSVRNAFTGEENARNLFEGLEEDIRVPTAIIQRYISAASTVSERLKVNCQGRLPIWVFRLNDLFFKYIPAFVQFYELTQFVTIRISGFIDRTLFEVAQTNAIEDGETFPERSLTPVQPRVSVPVIPDAVVFFPALGNALFSEINGDAFEDIDADPGGVLGGGRRRRRRLEEAGKGHGGLDGTLTRRRLRALQAQKGEGKSAEEIEAEIERERQAYRKRRLESLAQRKKAEAQKRVDEKFIYGAKGLLIRVQEALQASRRRRRLTVVEEENVDNGSNERRRRLTQGLSGLNEDEELFRKLEALDKGYSLMNDPEMVQRFDKERAALGKGPLRHLFTSHKTSTHISGDGSSMQGEVPREALLTAHYRGLAEDEGLPHHLDASQEETEEEAEVHRQAFRRRMQSELGFDAAIEDAFDTSAFDEFDQRCEDADVELGDPRPAAFCRLAVSLFKNAKVGIALLRVLGFGLIPGLIENLVAYGKTIAGIRNAFSGLFGFLETISGVLDKVQFLQGFPSFGFFNPFDLLLEAGCLIISGLSCDKLIDQLIDRLVATFPGNFDFNPGAPFSLDLFSLEEQHLANEPQFATVDANGNGIAVGNVVSCQSQFFKFVDIKSVSDDASYAIGDIPAGGKFPSNAKSRVVDFGADESKRFLPLRWEPCLDRRKFAQSGNGGFADANEQRYFREICWQRAALVTDFTPSNDPFHELPFECTGDAFPRIISNLCNGGSDPRGSDVFKIERTGVLVQQTRGSTTFSANCGQARLECPSQSSTETRRALSNRIFPRGNSAGNKFYYTVEDCTVDNNSDPDGAARGCYQWAFQVCESAFENTGRPSDARNIVDSQMFPDSNFDCNCPLCPRTNANGEGRNCVRARDFQIITACFLPQFYPSGNFAANGDFFGSSDGSDFYTGCCFPEPPDGQRGTCPFFRFWDIDDCVFKCLEISPNADGTPSFDDRKDFCDDNYNPLFGDYRLDGSSLDGSASTLFFYNLDSNKFDLQAGLQNARSSRRSATTTFTNLYADASLQSDCEADLSACLADVAAGNDCTLSTCIPYRLQFACVPEEVVVSKASLLPGERVNYVFSNQLPSPKIACPSPTLPKVVSAELEQQGGFFDGQDVSAELLALLDCDEDDANAEVGG